MRFTVGCWANYSGFNIVLNVRRRRWAQNSRCVRTFGLSLNIWIASESIKAKEFESERFCLQINN
jgi:hypothetical protein